MLLTTVARRRQIELWRDRARAAAERLNAFAERLVRSGARDRAFVFSRAAYRALLYVQRCEAALNRLRMA